MAFYWALPHLASVVISQAAWDAKAQQRNELFKSVVKNKKKKKQKKLKKVGKKVDAFYGAD